MNTYLSERLLQAVYCAFLSMCDNQFGFKAKHGTDLCVFALKQVVGHYNERVSPVFSVFVDSSKAWIKLVTIFNFIIQLNVMPLSVLFA